MRHTHRIGSLTWTFCKSPVDNRVLDEHERVLGMKFPGDLREVLQRCHGGHPVEKAVFWFEHPDPDLGRMGSGIGALVTLDPLDGGDDMLGIVQTLREYQDLPSGIVPFATDGGGDYICLDYRKDTDHPTVVYWAHEADPGQSIAYLADSFTDFLGILEPPEPLPDDES